MKLYSYSSELHTFVEAKWAIAKFAVGGILMGTVILFGVIKADQFVDNALGSRRANTLAAENNILRQQLSLISPRVSNLEMQAAQLNERAGKLHLLVHRRRFVADTVRSFTIATTGFKLQSLIPAATSSGP